MGNIGSLIGLITSLSKFKDWILTALSVKENIDRWDAAKVGDRVRYTLDDDSPIRFAVGGSRAELVSYRRLEDGSIEFELEKLARKRKRRREVTPSTGREVSPS